MIVNGECDGEDIFGVADEATGSGTGGKVP